MKDPVTGEMTERHRLPHNWKFYLRPDGYGPKKGKEMIEVEEDRVEEGEKEVRGGC